MNPGELRHKITIKRSTQSQDTFGQQTESLETVRAVRASINPIVGKEFFAAETVNSEVTHKIRMRYYPGITPDMRIQYGLRHFNIEAVIDYKELHTELQLMCRELI